eukprot:scaffold103381_cov35-Phaeocystis_antarctica.AAC.1
MDATRNRGRHAPSHEAHGHVVGDLDRDRRVDVGGQHGAAEGCEAHPAARVGLRGAQYRARRLRTQRALI